MRPIYLFLIACIIGGIGMSVTADWDRGHGLWHRRTDFKTHKKQLVEISRHLRNYHKITGRYPTNDEGLRVVSSLREIREEWTHPLYRFVTEDGDVLSIWGEPFIYENRNGLPESAFDGSGVSLDKEHVYSIQVDRGIYVWSKGAQDAYSSYKNNLYILDLMRRLFFGASIICLLSFAIKMSSGHSRYKRVFSTIGYGLGGSISALILSFITAMLVSGFTGGALMRTCYECYVAHFPDVRTPQLTKEYLDLMDKYHKRGVISDSAYEKIRESMSKKQNDDS